MSRENFGKAELKKWWDERYGELKKLGYNKSSVRDVTMSQLEIEKSIEIIGKNTKSDGKILEIGCGVGHFLVELKKRFGNKYQISGIDLSHQAIENTICDDSIVVKQADAFDFLNQSSEIYDVIYTQRVIINFLTKKNQFDFLELAINRLSKNGILILDEIFLKDLKSHNDYRSKLDLPPLGLADHIVPLDENYLRTNLSEKFNIETINYLNSYMLLTHIIYPSLEKNPKYDMPLHKFASELPDIGNGFSPYKILVLRKKNK